ncbi:TetR/AcrR family transcriptional regulator [Cellulomonas alba]|uniref:TetR/AcrR family transcriptional regulator n=1 Tax=Cellulomonas alba TaxID=3053467 RepID=A0ABT7SK40_9CELL|nr:TetR/AcrR family transcriptional regulator [Cellulomonas alba]MDM7856555.1 TetR/AcrR family transcriptional regulator [Cellulomonas alba]
MTTPLSGRKAQAARNDETILAAARAVFMRSPGAPVAAVAQEAGVGVSALYRRYASKEELLATLCADGLDRFIAVARAAQQHDDPWDAFAAWVRGVIEEDVHSLTVHLAGTFTPTPALGELSQQAITLGEEIFDRAVAAGVLRDGLEVGDVTMIFEQVTAVRVADAARTTELRRRYTELLLDAVRPAAASAPLPASAPTGAELGERWVPRDR